MTFEGQHWSFCLNLFYNIERYLDCYSKVMLTCLEVGFVLMFHLICYGLQANVGLGLCNAAQPLSMILEFFEVECNGLDPFVTKGHWKILDSNCQANEELSGLSPTSNYNGQITK